MELTALAARPLPRFLPAVSFQAAVEHGGRCGPRENSGFGGGAANDAMGEDGRDGEKKIRREARPAVLAEAPGYTHRPPGDEGG